MPPIKVSDDPARMHSSAEGRELSLSRRPSSRHLRELYVWGDQATYASQSDGRSSFESTAAFLRKEVDSAMGLSVEVERGRERERRVHPLSPTGTGGTQGRRGRDPTSMAARWGEQSRLRREEYDRNEVDGNANAFTK